MPVRVLVEACAIQRLLVGLPAEVVYLAIQEAKESGIRTKEGDANNNTSNNTSNNTNTDTDSGSGTGTDFPRSTGSVVMKTLHDYLSWAEDIMTALEQLQARGEEVQLVLRVTARGPDEHTTGPAGKDDQGQNQAAPRLVLEELYSAALEVLDDY